MSPAERTDRWRVLPFTDAPMGRQLALSEGMLAGLADTGLPALRWYVPREPALVLGNGQAPSTVDVAACGERGVHVWRRTSGGTAVYVDAQLVSADFAIPARHPLATPDVVQAYRWIGELWEDVLQRLGVAKARALPTEEVRAIPPLAKNDPLRLACYGTLSPWEVAVGKRKAVGLCQVRRKPGTLYQIGVHLRYDPKALPVLLDLGNNARKTLGTRLHNAVVGLDQPAGREITTDEIVNATEHAMAERLGARLTPTDWHVSELREADRLERERFQPLL